MDLETTLQTTNNRCVAFVTHLSNIHWANCGTKDGKLPLDYDEELLEAIRVYLIEVWGITL